MRRVQASRDESGCVSDLFVSYYIISAHVGSESLFNKGVAIGQQIAVRFGDEQTKLPNRPDRPTVEVYQSARPGRKTRWPPPDPGYARGDQRHLLPRGHGLPVAPAAPRLSQVAKRLCLFQAVARRRHLAAHPRYTARRGAAPSGAPQASDGGLFGLAERQDDPGHGGARL